MHTKLHSKQHFFFFGQVWEKTVTLCVSYTSTRHEDVLVSHIFDLFLARFLLCTNFVMLTNKSTAKRFEPEH